MQRKPCREEQGRVPTGGPMTVVEAIIGLLFFAIVLSALVVALAIMAGILE